MLLEPVLFISLSSPKKTSGLRRISGFAADQCQRVSRRAVSAPPLAVAVGDEPGELSASGSSAKHTGGRGDHAVPVIQTPTRWPV
jgi:hypothetical protein